MSSSSRDSWERLVAAVLKREQIWQLCHQNSISTISSEDSDEQILHLSSNRLASLSVSPSPPIPLKTPPVPRGPTRKLFSAWYRRRESEDKYLVNIPEHLQIHLGRLRRFSLQELQVATDNFSVKNVLYDTFSEFYKGRIADGSLVAVKRPKNRVVENAKRSFLVEVEIDSLTAHPNVLHLIGFCITQKEWLLVYPYMVGNVALQLKDRHESQSLLNWPTRERIAVEVAKGVAHLHEECEKKIFHRDIKAANIWLNEDFEAVVAGMELGIVAEQTHSYVDDAVRGTIGHIAPEYLSTGKCSEKNDVFGYGVFLLELITGQRAFDLARLANDEDVMLLDFVKKICLEGEWQKLVGEDFGGDCMKEMVVEQLVQLALICTQNTPQARPMMSEVVGMLEDGDSIKKKWEEWLRDEWLRDEFIIKIPVTYDDTSLLASEELTEPR